MTRALWLLLTLRLKGWVRKHGRTMASVRGALLIVVSAAVILLWILPNALRGPASQEDLLRIRQIAPFVLLGVCVVNLLFSTGERVIAFSPAEVNFLFPGPVSRRQLLLYKILIAAGGAVLTGLLMMFLLRPQFYLLVAGFVGMTLAVLFLQLLTMTLALVGSTLGAKAHTRQRQIVLGAAIVVVAVAALQIGLPRLQGGFFEALNELRQAPVVNILLTPFQWLVNTFTAERIWPDLAQWAALSLVANVVLVVVIMFLDVHYLETAAAVSERVYARLQRMRQGGTAAMSVPAGKPRLTLGGLPRWGGIGPLAWRQLTTALRNLWSLFALVLIFAFALMPAFFQEAMREEGAAMILMSTVLISLTLFIQPLLPFDFRGDLDRMELLKSLPVSTERLVLGQLLAPVFIVTLLQLLILALAQALWQKWEPLLAALAAFAVPVNLLLFGVENLLFLLFPTRLAGASPGDLHLFGRNVLLWMAKILCVLVAALPPALLAAVAYFLSAGNWPATLAAAWIGLIADLVGLIPLVAFAFHKFDVATDIPA